MMRYETTFTARSVPVPRPAAQQQQQEHRRAPIPAPMHTVPYYDRQWNRARDMHKLEQLFSVLNLSFSFF